MQIRRANLDFLRATAIIVVLIHHIGQYVDGVPEIFRRTMSFGAFGVDLFFVLSGWLIGGIYFREYLQKGEVNLISFWGRRWLRTMPPFYAALILSWLAVYFSRHEAFDLKYLFFLQNYSELLPYFKISWSLCIEEHFYIFLPLFLLVFLRIRLVVTACIGLILASFVMRLSYTGTVYPTFGYWLTATHLRLDGLAFGVLCAYIYQVKPDSWMQFSSSMMRIGSVAAVLAIVLYATRSAWMYSFGILALSIAFSASLIVCVNAKDSKLSKSKPVYTIAVTSYSIYLVHALLINIVMQYMHSRGVMFVLACLASTAVVTFFFHFAVEEFSRRMRDRFFPSEPRGQQAPAMPREDVSAGLEGGAGMGMLTPVN